MKFYFYKMDISGLKIILLVVLIIMITILIITFHVNRFNDYYTVLRNLTWNEYDIENMKTKPKRLLLDKEIKNIMKDEKPNKLFYFKNGKFYI